MELKLPNNADERWSQGPTAALANYCAGKTASTVCMKYMSITTLLAFLVIIL